MKNYYLCTKFIAALYQKIAQCKQSHVRGTQSIALNQFFFNHNSFKSFFYAKMNIVNGFIISFFKATRRKFFFLRKNS